MGEFQFAQNELQFAQKWKQGGLKTRIHFGDINLIVLAAQ
jgi:hypothetical protein